MVIDLEKKQFGTLHGKDCSSQLGLIKKKEEGFVVDEMFVMG